jgi:hypothetical protein
MKSTFLLILAATLTLSGCAARMTQPEAPAPIRVGAGAASTLVLNLSGSQKAMAADNWELMKGVWRDAFSQAAKAARVPFSFQEGAATRTGQPGTLLAVHIDDYRYISTGARYGFGVMTGNAYIESTVRFIDLSSGEAWGERPYSTASSAWQGIFSAMAPKQVEAICTDMVNTSLGQQ